MEQRDDGALRARTAVHILKLIKSNGGTGAQLAAFLRVSPATISNWQSGDPKRVRRVGAPTNPQLQRMVGFLCARIKMNQRDSLRLVLGGVIRHREQMMLLKSLAPAIAELNEDWINAAVTKAEQVDSFIERLREYHENNGKDARPEEYWAELQRYCSHMESLPTPDELAQGLVTWDYDNLKRHMMGFDEGVKAIEAMAEDLLEEADGQE